MEMYEHYLKHGHVEFLFWGYKDKKKKNLLPFNQWIELLTNQKYLWICISAKKEKKKRKRLNCSFPIIFISRKCMSYQLHSFPWWISLIPQIPEILCYPSVLHKLLVSRPNSSQIKLAKLNRVKPNKGMGELCKILKRVSIKEGIESVWNIC